MTQLNRTDARVTFINEDAGFAMLEDDSIRIRLRLNCAGRHREEIVPGATVSCRYTTTFNPRAKGTHDRHLHDVEQVFSVEPPAPPVLAIVVFMHDKGWGKVAIPGVEVQAYLPRSVWTAKGVQPVAGMKMLATITVNSTGSLVAAYEESVEVDADFDAAYPPIFVAESEEELVFSSFSPVKKQGLMLTDDGERIWFKSNQIAKSLRKSMFDGKFAEGTRFVVARGSFAGFPALRIERLVEEVAQVTESVTVEVVEVAAEAPAKPKKAPRKKAEPKAKTVAAKTEEPEATKPEPKAAKPKKVAVTDDSPVVHSDESTGLGTLALALNGAGLGADVHA